MKSQRTKKKNSPSVSHQLWVILTTLFVVALSLIGLLDLGLIGRTLWNLVSIAFGSIPELYFVLFIIIAIATLIFYRKPLTLKWYHLVGLFVLWMALQLTLVLIANPPYIGWEYLSNYFSQIGPIFNRSVSSQGGVFGALLFALSSFLFEKLGTIIVTTVLVFAGLLLIFNNSLETFISQLEKRKRKPKPKAVAKKKEVAASITQYKQVDMAEALALQKEEENKKSIFISSDEVRNDFIAPTTTSTGTDLANGDYIVPSLDLLDPPLKPKNSGSNQQSASVRGEKLISILKQFDISCSLIETHIGPSVTKFVLKLDSGVKVNRISSLQDNLMMELAVKDIRIEAPIPGKNAVGVEIPNIEMTPVRLSEILSNIPTELTDKKLLFGLGKNLMGESVFSELNKMPHLLIAGATGSGKSVAVNSLITTLLMRTRPSEVKLLLIDPKKVEFTVFNDIPHLIAPVVSDPIEAAKSLRVIVNIMENRYDAFSKEGARNISSYNELVEREPQRQLKFMPNIVIIIDELADLMAVAGKEVETSIQRITQLARAAGIHLVVATQRPSVDVITGIIKANIPSRIAFAVSSGTDSRTILDTVGAENLLGYGDMLYLPIGAPHPTRIQGAYVSDKEVEKVTQFVKQQAKPHFDDAFLNLEGVDENSGYVEALNDPLYEEVKEFVITEQKASTSLLQRRFGIGYNRGARLIDTLESQGIIGPAQGSKPRDVYIKPLQEEE